MATTEEYLDSLNRDKDTLVANLNTKGVTADNTETFTTLSKKVLDIPAGGVDSYFINPYTATKLTLRDVVKTFPKIETPNLTDISYAFDGCTGFLEFPDIDLSKVTNSIGMCQDCNNLITAPSILNIPNTTTIAYMFYKCYKLAGSNNNGEITINAPKATRAGHLFERCWTLKKITINSDKLESISSMCEGCSHVETINELNGEYMYIIDNAFYSCGELINFNGIKNLGKAYNGAYGTNYSQYKLDLYYSTKLTHESLMNIINNLYDIKTAGVKPQQLIIGATNMAKLTPEEIAIATNKGWSVS